MHQTDRNMQALWAQPFCLQFMFLQSKAPSAKFDWLKSGPISTVLVQCFMEPTQNSCDYAGNFTDFRAKIHISLSDSQRANWSISVLWCFNFAFPLKASCPSLVSQT